ncbi:hypothetical protein PHLCEN_2v761 [Hermanssonia centrifuga]|uniref:Uncharacterized protein n=1 Tax=Hermanssonia centrifuga TaxID=98765 RepID=A0A2R6S530_9APHY|nr:hypothetical protein PHLCEN_2v761 [Hermanssonia centrifuga]
MIAYTDSIIVRDTVRVADSDIPICKIDARGTNNEEFKVILGTTITSAEIMMTISAMKAVIMTQSIHLFWL